MFAVHANFCTTLQAYQIKLVLGWYAILNINYIADWEHIWQRKQEQINCNNKHNKNMRRNNHQNRIGDKILVKCRKNSKHEQEFMGPFLITQKMTMSRLDFKKESSMMPPTFAE